MKIQLVNIKSVQQGVISHPSRHDRTVEGPHGTAEWERTAVELFPSSSSSKHPSRHNVG